MRVKKASNGSPRTREEAARPSESVSVSIRRQFVCVRFDGRRLQKNALIMSLRRDAEDLSSLRGRFAPEDVAPFPSDERVKSCAQ